MPFTSRKESAKYCGHRCASYAREEAKRVRPAPPFRWHGTSEALKQGQQNAIERERRTFLIKANQILQHLLEDASNGKLIVSQRGLQAHQEVQPLMIMHETDVIEYLQEPVGQIIYDPKLTGIVSFSHNGHQ